ncbi:5-oxoprolinase subunit PxpA [Winogradskyella sp. UBA3174]|uniref:5-oxoprolinase subunit PxpA n=1 Tax=Winogradskyella sp. UBA3174 TaxID=1947785 RepID=UPI0025F888CE|nr:5-oxoprolinase subunit PxpA [Winogradskyella sp. UBA3174]|tara:strand:+ start:11000 stop:11743 length:744 start_codon:yes stop_codon:yes gene_type:complete
MKDYLHIDINADVGEGIGNESMLMPYLSSCNIACGGHAGDIATMTEVVKLAKTNNVKIGAHPSFPDKANFGRVAMYMTSSELYTSLKQQIRSLQIILDSENLKLNHIKPHGALYNLAAKDKEIAIVIIDVLKSFSAPLKLYAPKISVIANMAKANTIEVVNEAFADRNYNDDLSLVSRKKDNAILNKKEAVLNHVLGIIKHQKITVIRGVEVELKAETICVHSDTENAIEILKFLQQELPKNKIQII